MAGYMIRHPLAGNLFAFFHYLLGLHRLGHEIVYVEESGWAQSCYDPNTQTYSDDPKAGLRAVESLLDEYGVAGKVCFVNRETGATYGAEWDEIKSILEAADLLLNIGGVSWLPEFLLTQRRVWIDMDPFFTQIGQFGLEGREHYHAYFSYGTNIGQPDCTIPSDDIDWQPIVPPVVTDIWQREPIATNQTQLEPNSPSPFTTSPFTTVANWSAYGAVNYEGESYGQKDEEFLRLVQLPQQITQTLEIALSGADAAVREMLQANGWRLREGADISIDSSIYRAYVAGSRAEFSVAKNAYVKTRSGWLSDRTVCYLAAGRPVVIQDTGFSNWLSADLGVVAFSSLEEAVAGIEEVNQNYDAHAQAARQIAKSVFDYKVVLPRLLQTLAL